MRDVIKTVSAILFYCLAAAVLMWTASLTMSLVARMLPGDSITPFFALALFDGGALAWALVFLFRAEGLPQRAISLMAMAIDIVGVIGVSMAELFLGGQQLTAIPEGLGTLVVYGIGAWTAINLLAIYAFHIADPREMQEIRLRSLQDQVMDEALKQVEANVRQEAAILGARIAAGIHADVLARLRLRSGPVIDGVARDVASTGNGSSPKATYASDTTDTGTKTDPTSARTKR